MKKKIGFIGLGAIIASALPYMMTNWFGISNVAADGGIPDSVKFSFYLGGIAYFCAVMWTVIKTKEYPPDDIEALKAENAERGIFQGLAESFMGIFKMPKTMVQLAFVQFFSWFALFAMWIYTTSAVTSHVYGTSDTTSEIYNEGADWVGICFAVYNGIAALVAFLLPVIAKKLSRRITHLVALVLGGLGLISVYFISDPNLLLVSMVGGRAVAYALWKLQERSDPFVSPGDEVYEGMIIGENSRDNDLTVNPCREKKLTNIRAAGSDDAILLRPPREMSLETALEYIESDEYVEVTPRAIRLRKILLTENERKRGSTRR